MQLMFTVYDVKAQVYTPPFFVPTKGIAIRAFEDCVNSEDHQFAKHPQDYTLFELGSFRAEDGFLDYHAPKSVGNGLEFLRPDELKQLGALQNGAAKPTISDNQNSGDSA